MMQPQRRRFVRVKEAVVYAGIPRRTLYRLIHAGRIDARKDGTRQTFIDLDTIDRYFAELPKVQKTTPGDIND